MTEVELAKLANKIGDLVAACLPVGTKYVLVLNQDVPPQGGQVSIAAVFNQERDRVVVALEHVAVSLAGGMGTDFRKEGPLS